MKYISKMENPYIKQYPDLMVGKKILYVHGFGSSARSGTVIRIQSALPNAEVIAYDLPLHPAEAMELLHRVCNEQQPDLIIGTSMGGMYAEMLYGYDRILVNPAFQMGKTMHEHNMMGKQTFQNLCADGVQEFIVTKALVKEYKDITEQCFSDVTPEEQQRVYGLFGDEDTTVHTFDLFRSHYTNAIHFHGAHRLDDRSLMHGVIPVVRWMDDKQEGRERSIVYISVDTLADVYGKPKSSLNKVYDYLIEHYAVYIVAPAPTDDHPYLTQTQQWAEQYLSTPAHDRVIFCNRHSLLYGDYFIASIPDKDFMGTRIAFGSDEFKTWETVLTFFERVNGG